MVTELRPFFELHKDLDSLFGNFFTPLSVSQRRRSYPPINISVDDAALYITCEIPGIDMNDIDITLSDGSLSISGEIKATQGKFYRQERPFGAFQRVVNLNEPVDPDSVKATLKDGILEVILPKAEETKPKKISIETL